MFNRQNNLRFRISIIVAETLKSVISKARAVID
jgi:hypothetical protein